MAISAGIEQYIADVLPVKARGLLLSDEELEQALTSDVADIVHDLAGRELLAEILEGIAGTDFDDAQIRTLLDPAVAPEGAHVAEALAQAFLTGPTATVGFRGQQAVIYATRFLVRRGLTL